MIGNSGNEIWIRHLCREEAAERKKVLQARSQVEC